jgi:hypothetical protein
MNPHLKTHPKQDKSLLLQRHIALLESPSSRVPSALREWLHGPTNHPNTSTKLDDLDREVFSFETDLVALRLPPDRVIHSRVLRDHWAFPAEVEVPLPITMLIL